MADFRAIPQGAFEVVAALDAPLAVCNAYLVAVALADDWGRLEGSPKMLARRLGCERDEAQDMLADLMGLGLVRVYTVTDARGQAQQVAEVVGYHELRGHMVKVTNAAQRRDSIWPPEDSGTVSATHAHTRAHDARTHAPITGAHMGAHTGAGARPSRARDAQAHDAPEERRGEKRREELSPPPGERERDRAEHVASQDRPSSVSAPRGPVGTAPLEGGASPAQGRYPPITAYDEREPATIGQRRVNGAKTALPAPLPPRPDVFIGASGTEYPEEDPF